MGFQHIGGDLLAAVGGQRVLHHAVRLCQRHAGGVQRKAGKVAVALLGLALHTHADPHVGEQHIRVPRGLVRVVRQRELIPVLLRQYQHVGGGAVAFGQAIVTVMPTARQPTMTLFDML